MFASRWAVASFVAALLVSAAVPAHAVRPVPSVLQLAKPGESGKPLVIRGRVVDASGNPLPGVSVRVYHADLHGEYGRLDGTLTTGPNGVYEIRTIRPGSYGYAAHVHYVVTRGSAKAYFQLLFGDDVRKREPGEKQKFPMLADSLLRRWNAANHGLHTEEVRPVVIGSDGVHRVERDLQLQ